MGIMNDRMDAGANNAHVAEFLKLQAKITVGATVEVFAEQPGFKKFVEAQEEIGTLNVLAGGQ